MEVSQGSLSLCAAGLAERMAAEKRFLRGLYPEDLALAGAVRAE
jgi:hypothetical protein